MVLTQQVFRMRIGDCSAIKFCPCGQFFALFIYSFQANDDASSKKSEGEPHYPPCGHLAVFIEL
jgi:hypothetical protein